MHAFYFTSLRQSSSGSVTVWLCLVYYNVLTSQAFSSLCEPRVESSGQNGETIADVEGPVTYERPFA